MVTVPSESSESRMVVDGDGGAIQCETDAVAASPSPLPPSRESGALWFSKAPCHKLACDRASNTPLEPFRIARRRYESASKMRRRQILRSRIPVTRIRLTARTSRMAGCPSISRANKRNGTFLSYDNGTTCQNTCSSTPTSIPDTGRL